MATPLPHSKPKPQGRKAVYDLSERAVSVGREIDRRGSGRHLLDVTKSEIKAEEWRLNVMTLEVVQKRIIPSNQWDAETLARELQDLVPGHYVIDVTVSDSGTLDCRIEILRSGAVHKMSLSMYSSE